MTNYCISGHFLTDPEHAIIGYQSDGPLLATDQQDYLEIVQ